MVVTCDAAVTSASPGWFAASVTVPTPVTVELAAQKLGRSGENGNGHGEAGGGGRRRDGEGRFIEGLVGNGGEGREGLRALADGEAGRDRTAALKLALPAWLALSTTVPTPVSVTKPPAIFAGPDLTATATGSPELAVGGVTANGVTPKLCAAMVLKGARVCADFRDREAGRHFLGRRAGRVAGAGWPRARRCPLR